MPSSMCDRCYPCDTICRCGYLLPCIFNARTLSNHLVLFLGAYVLDRWTLLFLDYFLVIGDYWYSDMEFAGCECNKSLYLLDYIAINSYCSQQFFLEITCLCTLPQSVISFAIYEYQRCKILCFRTFIHSIYCIVYII